MQKHETWARRRRLEWTLWVAGFLMVGYCGWYGAEMHSASAAALPLRAPSLEAAQNATPPSGSSSAPGSHSASHSDVIGRIQISQLGVAAPITDGIDKLELIRGVGHVPGTAFPGGLGTMALAGHRDTFFRGLEHVSVGMRIRASGEGGTYEYQIDSTQIVTPEQVEILEIGDQPSLVLITCYPFHYIGAAPKRFIVHAKLLSLEPDTP